MKVILQRVLRASVAVDGEVRGSCGPGFLALVGVEKGDCEADARTLADKIAALRVFEDENGKMNLSVGDVGGSVLSISNFTLSASHLLPTSQGNGFRKYSRQNSPLSASGTVTPYILTEQGTVNTPAVVSITALKAQSPATASLSISAITHIL